MKPQRPDLVATAIAPDYALGSHVAALGLTFVLTAMSGARAQAEYSPPQGKGRDYGATFWPQQWLGLKRLLRALAGKRKA